LDSIDEENVSLDVDLNDRIVVDAYVDVPADDDDDDEHT
jgi:hypothetical protein